MIALNAMYTAHSPPTKADGYLGIRQPDAVITTN